ncbi:hypothetical protein [Spiroplasma citri]|uniref:Lipoprotein n=1 Tax=Spiroplasma citri TaxID=2133 RepID=A0AAJ4EIM5_SPICI|nr:hypothetical protein [Spiroplasma citri]APE74522.1 putative lipoprotein [Spiroplasma citri]QIA66709.1 hypothetical protein GMI18_03040 [Spiroplasma citri]QIA68582.1 hypothetical protein GL298_03090 [Spiroplasma citri]QIA70453.1 hypothetical protein GL981_03090 [Spiroplasma citri]QIA72692.1 hypothetical protein GL982_03105 [Spiroplasma citri]
MKKLLATIAIGILTSGPVMSVVSCTKNDNWNNIPIAPPVLPVEVTGFAGIDFKTINPQNNKQTIPELLQQLAQLFKGTKWNFEQLIKNYKFNNQSKPVNKIDLYRNGQYELNFSDGTTLNTIKINKTVTTSNHLADKVKSIDLGQITDARPKTILIAIIFNNMQLISELENFGEFFIGEQTSAIWNKQIDRVDKIEVEPDQTSATLISGNDHWSEHNNPATDYYGSVKVHFTVVAPKPPTVKEDLEQMNLITNLGKLPKVTILQVMMMFISVNFVSQLNRLSALLNDLYLDINPDKKSGTITAYEKSEYYTGSINVTFS